MKKGITGIRSLLVIILLIAMTASLFAGCSGTADDQTTPSETATPTVASTPSPTSSLSGTLTISMPFAEQKPVWEDLAAAYMSKNPGVTIVIDDKDSSTYATWLGTQLAGEDITADIVLNNTAIAYYAMGKFVDYSSYLNKGNPYADGATWKDILEPQAYSFKTADGIFTINSDFTQVLWMYNKDIFAEAGATVPTNWDELVAACEQIKTAGYTPLALAGDANSLTMQLGWLMWIYTDQYFRDLEPLAVTVEGDYNYDADKMSAWIFDSTNPLNDSADNVDFNAIRVLQMLSNGEVGADTDKYREMMTNFAKIIPDYVPDGFFGTDVLTAKNLFLQGKAAIYIATVDFAASFDGLMADSAEPFELGYFSSPPMTGDNVGVDYTRAVGGQVGFIGVTNKTTEQNDLAMDFMMYYLSPEGQSVRYESMVENAMAPQGASLVKGSQMPDTWQDIFSTLDVSGAAPTLNPYIVFSEGLSIDQESVRVFQDNLQQYLQGQITVDSFSATMQQALVEAIPRYLALLGFREDAISDPSVNPF